MLKKNSINDFIGGFFTILFGLGFVFGSLQYDLGSSKLMGSGYFPFYLGISLTIVGFVVFANSIIKIKEINNYRFNGFVKFSIKKWRPLFFVVTAIAAFALLINSFGLASAVLITTLLGAAGGEKFFVLKSLFLGLGLLVAIWFVFVYSLNMPFLLIRGL